MMRQLTQEEKKLTEANIKRIEEEKEYYEWLVTHATAMLTQGLMANFKLQQREYEAKKREAIMKSREADYILLEAKRQLREGVEVKPEVNDDGQ